MNKVNVVVSITVGVSLLGMIIFGIYIFATSDSSAETSQIQRDIQQESDHHRDSSELPHKGTENDKIPTSPNSSSPSAVVKDDPNSRPDIDSQDSSSPSSCNQKPHIGKISNHNSFVDETELPHSSLIPAKSALNTATKPDPSGGSALSATLSLNVYTQVCTLFEMWIKKFDSGAFLYTDSIPKADFDSLRSTLILASNQKVKLPSTASTPIQSFILAELQSAELTTIETLFYNYYFPLYKQGILEYKGTGNEEKRLQVIFSALSLTCPTLFNCENQLENSGDFILADSLFFKVHDRKSLFPPNASNSAEFTMLASKLGSAVCFKVFRVTPAIIEAAPILYNYSGILRECVTKVDSSRSEPYLLALKSYVEELTSYFSKSYTTQRSSDEAYARLINPFSKVQEATPPILSSADKVQLPTKHIATTVSVACEEADKSFNDALAVFFQRILSSGARTCEDLEKECQEPNIMKQQLEKIYLNANQQCCGEPASLNRKDFNSKTISYSKFYDLQFNEFMKRFFIVLKDYASDLIAKHETETPEKLSAVDFARSFPYPPDAHIILRSTMAVHFEKLLGKIVDQLFLAPSDTNLLIEITALKAKLDAVKSPESLKTIFFEKFPKYLKDTFSASMSDVDFEKRVTNIPRITGALQSIGCSLDVNTEWMKKILENFVNEELYSALLLDLKLRSAASYIAFPPGDAWEAMKPKRKPSPSLPKSLTPAEITDILNLMRQIAFRTNAKREFLPERKLSLFRICCAAKRSTDGLSDYFQFLMDRLLDEKDALCISSAQDIYAALKRIDKNVFDSQTSGNYAIVRLKNKLLGKSELSVDEIERFKLYLQILDGLAESGRYLRDWSANLGEKKMTGAFYYAFLHADISILKAYSVYFRNPETSKPSLELDQYLP